MEKYFDLWGKTAEGRPLIHLVEPGSTYGLGETGDLEKTASGEHLPGVIQLIEAIQPQPGRIYLVNSALGAGEYVGFNLRGDWFTERGLLHTPQGWEDIPVWDIDRRRQLAAQTEYVPRWGDMAWGFPTFYNAHRFRHHANKNPDRAYGYVLGAFWDPRMHRVILVSELVEDLCRRLGAFDLYQRIQNGEFPDTSMGAKVPSDRCSVCNHVAKTPAAYCEHVRRGAAPPYGMRSILPDGRMCGVYNDYPRFFDDSFVFIGAERSAKVMDNITSKVKGANAYTSRVYTPTPLSRTKTAGYNPGEIEPNSTVGLSAAPASEIEFQETQLAGALIRAGTPNPVGPSSRSIGEKISRVLSVIPVAGDKEEKALRHAIDLAKKKEGIKDGIVTKAELDIWTDKALRELHTQGVAQIQIDRMRNLLSQQLQHAYGDKIASTPKWAERLKRIPAPSHTQMALLADHVGRMPPLPEEVLDYIREDLKQRLKAAAALGVVLRPDEFQYCSLPEEQARGYREKNILFHPVSPAADFDPRWRASSHLHDHGLSEMASRLKDVLDSRSFAPRIVAIRIIRPRPIVPCSAAQPTREFSEELNKVAQGYLDYRAGLLAQIPDWRYVSPACEASATIGEVTKVGDAAGIVSNFLLHLAYWPGIPVG